MSLFPGRLFWRKTWAFGIHNLEWNIIPSLLLQFLFQVRLLVDPLDVEHLSWIKGLYHWDLLWGLSKESSPKVSVHFLIAGSLTMLECLFVCWTLELLLFLLDLDIPYLPWIEILPPFRMILSWDYLQDLKFILLLAIYSLISELGGK